MSTVIRRTRTANEAPQETVTAAPATSTRVRRVRATETLTEAPALEENTGSLEGASTSRAARRVRPVAQPAPELIEALEIIDKAATPAESSTSRVDYDAIIERYRREATTPKKAIRAKCVECMGGMVAEIRRCTSETTCASWPFRMGSNPFHKLSKHNKDNQGDQDE